MRATIPYIRVSIMPSKELVPAGDPLVDVKLVEDSVTFINEKLNQSVYTTFEEIGIYILEKFFGGDTRLTSSRNPRKSASYRALCKHEGLAIDPARLSVMVRVAIQERFFADHKLNTENLSYTHKAELVKMPDGDEKLKLVKTFQKKGISTRDAAELIAEKRRIVKRSKPSDLPDNDSLPIEKLPFDVKAIVDAVLAHPVRSIGAKPEELLALIDNPKQIVGVWNQLDNDKRGAKLKWIEIQLNDAQLLVRAFTVLQSEMRRLQGLE